MWLSSSCTPLGGALTRPGAGRLGTARIQRQMLQTLTPLSRPVRRIETCCTAFDYHCSRIRPLQGRTRHTFGQQPRRAGLIRTGLQRAQGILGQYI